MVPFKLEGQRNLATSPLARQQRSALRIKAEIARIKQSAASPKDAMRVGEWVPIVRPAAQVVESAPPIPKTSVAKPKTNPAPLRFLDLVEVEKLTNRNKSTIYAEMAAGTFPKQIKISAGGRRVGWVYAEVMELMHSRVDQRNEP